MKKFSDMKNAAAFDTAQISKHKEALTVKANTKSQSDLAGAKRIYQHLSMDLGGGHFSENCGSRCA